MWKNNERETKERWFQRQWMNTKERIRDIFQREPQHQPTFPLQQDWIRILELITWRRGGRACTKAEAGPPARQSSAWAKLLGAWESSKGGTCNGTDRLCCLPSYKLESSVYFKSIKMIYATFFHEAYQGSKARVLKCRGKAAFTPGDSTQQRHPTGCRSRRDVPSDPAVLH